MKKIFLICFIIFPSLFIHANDDFRIPNRRFELSLANMDLGLSNDHFIARDYLHGPFYILGNFGNILSDFSRILLNEEVITINAGEFLKGFIIDCNATFQPFSFKFDLNENWSFGLDIAHTNVSGNISLSENMLTLNETDQEILNTGMAVIVEALAIPVHFQLRNFRIKIKPAVYFPLLYAEPGINYSYRNVYDDNGDAIGIRLDAGINKQFYIPVNLTRMEDNSFNDIVQYAQNNFWNNNNISLGFDLSLGTEYPLFPWLDLGVDIMHIPFLFRGARMHYYLQLSGNTFLDTSHLDIAEIIANGGTIPEEMLEKIYGFSEPTFNPGSATKELYRPFKLLFYANVRPFPFDKPIVTLIPSAGFSINNLYPDIAAFEGGMSARVDLANLFITTLGINYNDRNWINSLDLAFNFRALELGIGLSMRSPDFVQSWRGAGMGLNLGLTFGW